MIRVVLPLVFALSACTGAAPGLMVHKQPPVPAFSRAVLERAGMPVLVATVERRGAVATLIQSGRNGDVVTWRTGDGVTLSFDRGILVATRGLGFDLMAADVNGTQRALDGARGPFVRVHRYLDGENRDRFERLTCEMAPPTVDPVAILGTVHATRRHTETCRGAGEPIVNQYWRTTDGRIWKTRQWVSAGTGHLVVETAVP